MVWQVVEIKAKQVKHKNKYLPAGRYLFTKTRIKNKMAPELSGKYCRMKGQHFGWVLPCAEWAIRLIYGIQPETLEIAESEKSAWKQNHTLLMNVRENLREYQVKVIQDVYDHIGAGLRYTKTLIAGLGSGKTLMALSIGKLVGGNLLIVAPTYLHDNWRAEAKKWGFDEPFISTYESIKKFKDRNVTTLILDENLRCKNQTTKRHKEAKEFAESCKVVIGMTATPLSGRGVLDWGHVCVGSGDVFPDDDDIIMQLFGLNPHLAPVFAGSDIEKLTVNGWDTEKVIEFLSPYLYIVDNDEVNKLLPEFTETNVIIDPPDDYEDFYDGWYTESESRSKAVAQSRQICSGFYKTDDGEIEEHNTIKLDWIKNWIKDNPEEPVVIFSHFIHGQRKLKEGLKEYEPACIFADTDQGKEIQRFNDAKTNVLIASSSLCEGWNVHQRASVAIFESNCLRSDLFAQAVGRVYRPGNPRPVTQINLIMEGTKDLKLLEILKMRSDLSEEQVLELLKGE